MIKTHFSGIVPTTREQALCQTGSFLQNIDFLIVIPVLKELTPGIIGQELPIGQELLTGNGQRESLGRKPFTGQGFLKPRMALNHPNPSLKRGAHRVRTSTLWQNQLRALPGRHSVRSGYL